MKKEYIPEEFWNQKQEPNRLNQPQDIIDTHIRYISDNINNYESILDYGCGIGRTFDAYNQTHNIVGVDVSYSFKDRAIDKANNLSLNFNWIHINDNKIPYPDKEFDTIVCCLVLMHIRPFEIIDLMKEFERVSDKCVIITKNPESSEDNKNVNKVKKYYTKRYAYDYLELCRNNGLEYYNVEYYENQIMFCYKGREDDIIT